MRTRLVAVGFAVLLAFLLATNPVVSDAAGKINGKFIKKNSVTSKAIKDGSLTSADVADGSLTGADVGDGSLTGADLANASVPQAKLGPLAISGAQVTDNSLTGADIDESTLSIPNKAGKLTFAGVAFEPRDGTTSKTYDGAGGVSAAGGTASFTLPLDLPQGATITKVTVFNVDNGAAANTAFLTSYTPSTSDVQDIAAGTSTGASATTQAITLNTSTVVDNTTKSYNILFQHGATGTAYELVGASVEYTFNATVGNATAGSKVNRTSE